MIELLINAIRGYVFAGLIFAVVFVTFGVQRMDPDATGFNLGFRLIIIPGVCIFWPLLAVRWLQGKRTPTERTAHRTAASLSQNPR